MCLEITEERRIVRFLRNKFPQLAYSDAKDALQEAYLQFYLLPEQKKCEINNTTFWLLKVAARYAHRAIKKNNRKVCLDDISEIIILKGNDFTIDPNKEHINKQLTEYIHLLPLLMRIVVHKHYIEGYTYKEIALMNCKSEESIKKCAQRALRILYSLVSLE